MSTVIELLALSQARGPKQEALVREFLTSEAVPYTPMRDYETGRIYAVRYGNTHLEHRSWLGLKARLQAVGFFTVRDYATKTLRLGFEDNVDFGAEIDDDDDD